MGKVHNNLDFFEFGKNWKQAGAELSQAQVKLDRVGIVVEVRRSLSYFIGCGWVAGSTENIIISSFN